MELTEKEQARLRRMVKRPRSRKQFYRAQALLALGEGQPLDAVARGLKVNPERVEVWAAGFEKLRIGYLAEPPGPGAKARWVEPEPDGDGD